MSALPLFSERLAAARSERDLSLVDVADRLRGLSRDIDGYDAGPTARTVWSWERGSRPRGRYRRLLCALYETTAEQLGFVAPAVRGEVLSGIGDGFVSRREALLTAIAGVTLAAGVVERGDRATWRLGHSDVARLDAVTALYRSLDYESGGGALLIDVGRFAETASSLLDHPCSDDVRTRLLAAVAGARQLAGWTAFDAGSHSDAQRHWLSAERAAVGADDVRLAARIRYCQAKQFQHLRHNRDALETLRLARAHLGSATTPAIDAMLTGAEASSLAALGAKQAALTALARARHELERVNPEREPPWMPPSPEGELLAQHGRVYRDLARADRAYGDQAVQQTTSAIDAFEPGNVRSRVLNEIGLASALFLAGAPEQAVAAGERAIEHAGEMTSARVIDRIRGLRRDLTDYANHPPVPEFARRLQQLPAA